jgi:transcriptional regulator NrdR family protein
MQCPKCNAVTSVSTTKQLGKEIKRHRRCKGCGHTFITMETILGSAPKGRPPKLKPVPDERGLFKKEDISAIKMQKVEVRRRNEDRVSSYYIEDDYE